MLATPHIAWSIWKERNNCIFQDKNSTHALVYEKANSGMLENLSRITQHIGSNRVLQSKKNDHDNSVWITPPDGWIKINFDGAAKGNPGLVGSGSVIKECNGNIIAANVVPLGTQNNHLVEALGA